jgi:hypothetical protein
VKATGVPTIPVNGPATVTTNGRAAIVTVAEAEAVLGAGVALSVPVTEIVFEPFTLYVVEKLAPVPDGGVPPVAVQLNVTAPTPFADVAVHVTRLPTVPVRGQLADTVKAPVIVMDAEPSAVTLLPSVTVTLTVKVPATAYIVVKLAVVPVAGEPPVAVQANV